MRTAPVSLARVLAFLVVLVGVSGPAGAQVPPPTASATGWASDFAGFGPLTGATVHVVEDPDRTATVAADGTWRIDGLLIGSEATFALELPGQFPIQTATFTGPEAGLERVSFQSPTDAMAGVLAQVIDEPIRSDRCQIASTVTRRGYALDVPGPDGTHGEPGATVTIEPMPATGGTPIYFNLSAATTIWPDRSLSNTTADGGVLFANVTPGTYVLRAHKPGAEVEPVTVRCTAGRLTNAAPPHGLQVVSGGLDLDDTVPFGPYGIDAPPTTIAPPGSSTTTTAIAAASGASPAAPVRGAARFTG